MGKHILYNNRQENEKWQNQRARLNPIQGP